MSKQEYVLILSQTKSLTTQAAAFFEALDWKIVIANRPGEVNLKWQHQDFKMLLILDVEEDLYTPVVKHIQAAHPATWIWIAKDFSRKSFQKEFTDKVIYMEMGDIERSLKCFFDLLSMNLGTATNNTQKKKQLVFSLDDDPAISSVLELMFLKLGYTPKLFNTEKDMLALLKDEKPDILFLDYSMPEITGAQVLRKVRAIYPKKELPVVFISGTQEAEKIKELVDLGINDFIVKPFDEAKLSEKVKKIVG